MKISIFVALLTSLLVQAVSAQKTLPISAQPYFAGLSPTQVKLMRSAGFAMPATAAPVAQQRSSPLQLDSTKTFAGYNYGTPTDSTPQLRSRYQYPQPGVAIEFNDYFENNAWAPSERITYVSDDQQRQTEIIAEVYDSESGGYRPDSRLQIFPRGDSPVLVDSFISSLWDADVMDWRVILQQNYVFDDQDRLQETVFSLVYFGDPLIFREYYSYDANGDNHLIEEYAILGDDEFPSSRTEKAFAADHFLIEELVSVFDTLGWTPVSRENYAYTLFGALRKHMSFEWDSETQLPVLVKTLDLSYDGEQRLSSLQTTISAPNTWDQRSIVHYAYIDDENLAQEWALHWDDDLFDWVLDTKKFYYYNGLTAVPNTPRSVLDLTTMPNPTTGFVQLGLGREAAVQVFDANGQLVQSLLLQPGQTLNLTQLPTGIYVVTARQDADYYSGKIVKQ